MMTIRYEEARVWRQVEIPVTRLQGCRIATAYLSRNWKGRFKIGDASKIGYLIGVHYYR
jgi:hypothetical protein